MTAVGLPYVGRRAVYEKGEANILFVLGQLKNLQPNADYDHLTLVGHSNGGDIAMFCAKHLPGLVSKVITLDKFALSFRAQRQAEDRVVPLKRPELQNRSRRVADP